MRERFFFSSRLYRSSILKPFPAGPYVQRRNYETPVPNPNALQEEHEKTHKKEHKKSKHGRFKEWFDKWGFIMPSSVACVAFGTLFFTASFNFYKSVEELNQRIKKQARQIDRIYEEFIHGDAFRNSLKPVETKTLFFLQTTDQTDVFDAAKKNTQLAKNKIAEIERLLENIEYGIQERETYISNVLFVRMLTPYDNPKHIETVHVDFDRIEDYKRVVRSVMVLNEALLLYLENNIYDAELKLRNFEMPRMERIRDEDQNVSLMVKVFLLNLRGLLARGKFELEKSVSYFEEARTLSPQNPIVLANCGNAISDAVFFDNDFLFGNRLMPQEWHEKIATLVQKVSDSIKQTTEADQLNKNNPFVLNTLAWQYFVLGNLTKIMGNIDESQKNFKYAYMIFESARLISPDPPARLLVNLGRLLSVYDLFNGHLAEAINMFNDILKKQPTHGDVRFLKAKALHHNRDYNSAETELGYAESFFAEMYINLMRRKELLKENKDFWDLKIKRIKIILSEVCLLRSKNYVLLEEYEEALDTLERAKSFVRVLGEPRLSIFTAEVEALEKEVLSKHEDKNAKPLSFCRK